MLLSKGVAGVSCWMAWQGDMEADVVAPARQELRRRAGGVIGALAVAPDAG
jgi:hypothetical protein